MDKIRRMFEGDHGTKTADQFVYSKRTLAVSFIGSLFCLLSFILALINTNIVACVIFYIAFLVCMSCGIEYLKNKKAESLME